MCTLLYKYVGVDGALSILQNRVLRFTPALRLNDPLELLPERFDPPGSDETKAQLERRLQEVVYAVDPPQFELNDGTARIILGMRATLAHGEDPTEDIAQLIEQLTDPDPVRELHTERMRSILGVARVCSFTEARDCPGMWSSFGRGFAGVVIGFEPPFQIPGKTLQPEQVKYSDDPCELRALTPTEWVDYLLDLRGLNPTRMKSRALLTKPKRYASEREWRSLLIPVPGAYGERVGHREFDRLIGSTAAIEPLDVPIDTSCISEVIVGQRVSDHDADALLEASRRLEPCPKVFKAAVSINSPDAVVIDPL